MHGTQTISRLIFGSAPNPDPLLPETFPEPDSIEVFDQEGADWTWDGSNVQLIHPNPSHTVVDAIETLYTLRDRDSLRPLNAGEFLQFKDMPETWPSHWLDCSGGARIFISGTIYRLRYGMTRVELIWSAWHDGRQWNFESVPTTVPLRPRDGFACVAPAPGMAIPESPDVPPIARPRRDRVRHPPHPRLPRKRYAA